MKIEQVVERFLELLVEEKLEQAKELIVKESQGEENELAYWLNLIGIENLESGSNLLALRCFEAAEKIVKSKEIKEEITWNLVFAHNNYASLLSEMKRFDEAESHFQESLKVNPESTKTHCNYASLLSEMKRFDEAEEHFKKTLELNPDCEKVHSYYACLLFETKRYEEAENHYKIALEIDPGYAITHNNYAILLNDMKRLTEAENHYKIALEIDPGYAITHNNYGGLLSDMKRFEEAEEHFKIALELNPDYAEAHNNYANVLAYTEKFEEAEEHFKITLELNPDYAEAHNNYANLLKDRSKYEEAEDHYKIALEIDPGYAGAIGNLGILYCNQKKYFEALMTFEKASKIFKKKRMLSDHKRAEALMLSTKAVLLWREESWGDIRKSLEEAISKFKACGREDYARIYNDILTLIMIDEDFSKSTRSNSLLKLRERTQKVYNSITELKGKLEEESEIFDHEIFEAKFICIELLSKALNLESFSTQNLDEARKIFRKEGFIKAIQSLKCLKSFVSDLSEFRDFGLEKIPEKEENRLLSKLEHMKYLNGYISERIFQEVQESPEPWRRSQTYIEYVDFKIPSKKWVRVGIVQFHFNLNFHNNMPIFPPKQENSDLIKEKFLKYLELAVRENLDIVCFPEYSMTPETLDIIIKKKIGNLIVVGGSYYKKRKNVCPIIFNNKIRYIQKIHPSKYCESSPVSGRGMIPGDRLFLFDTPAGKIMILICEDFRYELPNILSQVENLDFLIIISYNPNPERFHKISEPIPSNYPLYILHSNVSEMGGKFGKSCIFGIIDDNSADELAEEGLRPIDYRNKVSEIQGEGMIIAEFNLAQKTIPKPTIIDFQTIKNIKHEKCK